MSKPVKKIARVALPVLGTIIAPGLGTALGSSLTAGTLATIGGAVGGAAGGAIGGGGVKDALIGGVTGGLGGAVGGGLGGLTGATKTAAQGAIYGAGAGAQGGGGLKGALTGGVLGGAGGYVAGGGLSGIGSAVSGTESSILGAKAGTDLATLSGNAAMQGPTAGAGVLGSVTRAVPALSSSGGLTGGGGSMFGLGDVLRAGTGIYSSGQTQDAYDDIQRQLLQGQRQAMSAVQPFADTGLQAQQQLSERLTTGFNPGDLTQDPGYQFRLQQGNEALERSLAAQGLGQSGAAMKAAQEYGQGLADQTYNDAYSRWLAQNQQVGGLAQQGQVAATSLGNTLMGGGQTRAAATAAQQNEQNRLLASLLSGSGYAGVY